MKVVGKIHVIFDTQQISQTFKKREFVLDYRDNPLYPQYVKFEMIQDKCELLDSFEPGDNVEVSFNLKGREWTNPDGKKVYFTSLDAWRLQKVAEGQEAGAPASDSPVYDLADIAADEPDDLPF